MLRINKNDENTLNLQRNISSTIKDESHLNTLHSLDLHTTNNLTDWDVESAETTLKFTYGSPLPKSDYKPRCQNFSELCHKVTVPIHTHFRSPEREVSCANLYIWQKQKECTCRSVKSFRKLNKKISNIKPKVKLGRYANCDNIYMKKYLIYGLKKMGMESYGDNYFDPESYFFVPKKKEVFHHHKSCRLNKEHRTKIAKNEERGFTTKYPCNCRYKRFLDKEHDLKLQAFKECLVNKSKHGHSQHGHLMCNEDVSRSKFGCKIMEKVTPDGNIIRYPNCTDNDTLSKINLQANMIKTHYSRPKSSTTLSKASLMKSEAKNPAAKLKDKLLNKVKSSESKESDMERKSEKGNTKLLNKINNKKTDRSRKNSHINQKLKNSTLNIVNDKGKDGKINKDKQINSVKNNFKNVEEEDVDIMKAKKLKKDSTDAESLIDKSDKNVEGVLNKSKNEFEGGFDKSSKDVNGVTDKSKKNFDGGLYKAENEFEGVTDKSKMSAEGMLGKSNKDVEGVTDKSKMNEGGLDRSENEFEGVTDKSKLNAEGGFGKSNKDVEGLTDKSKMNLDGGLDKSKDDFEGGKDKSKQSNYDARKDEFDAKRGNLPGNFRKGVTGRAVDQVVTDEMEFGLKIDKQLTETGEIIKNINEEFVETDIDPQVFVGKEVGVNKVQEDIGQNVYDSDLIYNIKDENKEGKEFLKQTGNLEQDNDFIAKIGVSTISKDIPTDFPVSRINENETVNTLTVIIENDQKSENGIVRNLSKDVSKKPNLGGEVKDNFLKVEAGQSKNQNINLQGKDHSRDGQQIENVELKNGTLLSKDIQEKINSDKLLSNKDTKKTMNDNVRKKHGNEFSEETETNIPYKNKSPNTSRSQILSATQSAKKHDNSIKIPDDRFLLGKYSKPHSEAPMAPKSLTLKSINLIKEITGKFKCLPNVSHKSLSPCRNFDDNRPFFPRRNITYICNPKVPSYLALTTGSRSQSTKPFKYCKTDICEINTTSNIKNRSCLPCDYRNTRNPTFNYPGMFNTKCMLNSKECVRNIQNTSMNVKYGPC